MANNASMDEITARINVREIHIAPICTYFSVPSPPKDKNRLHSRNIFIETDLNKTQTLFIRVSYSLCGYALAVFGDTEKFYDFIQLNAAVLKALDRLNLCCLVHFVVWTRSQCRRKVSLICNNMM